MAVPQPARGAGELPEAFDVVAIEAGAAILEAIALEQAHDALGLLPIELRHFIDDRPSVV